jgi:hydrogenase maturation protease
MNEPASHIQYPIPRTLVLGLGNPILTDDGVGIHAVRAAAARYAPADGVTFSEASVGGLRLLDAMAGYERVILVDAIQTSGGRPGDVYQLAASDLPASLHSGSTHDMSLHTALDLGRRLGMKLPGDGDIIIFAVEAEDVLTFSDSCTQAVARAIPRAMEAVRAQLEAPLSIAESTQPKV